MTDWMVCVEENALLNSECFVIRSQSAISRLELVPLDMADVVGVRVIGVVSGDSF